MAGKAQSAQNAFRHGFNVPIWLDPDLVSDVGKGADANVLESARRVAEALRSHRNRLIERAMADPMLQTEAAEPKSFEAAAARIGSDDPGRAPRADPFDAKVSAIVAEFAKNLAALDRCMRPAKPSLAELARDLAALDRYERRALSRRKFAILEFDLARVEAAVVRRGATLSDQQP